MARQDLSFWQLMGLSAPALAFAAFEIAQRILLPSYLTDHVGLGVAVAGGLMMTVRIVDILADAVCGTLSDLDFTPGIGRRRFWITAGLPVALIATTWLFLAAPGTPLATLALAYVIASTGWTMINASHGAWALEATTGLVGRSRVFGARTFAGLLAFALLTGALALGQPTAQGRMETSLGFLWIAALPTTFLLFRFAPLVLHSAQSAQFADLLRAWRMSFASSARRRLSLLFALVGAHAAVTAGSYIYLVERGLSLPGWAMPVLFAQALATTFGLFVATALLRRVGVGPLLSAVFAINGVFSLLILILPPGNSTAFLIWAVARGLLSGTDFMVLRALLGEELDIEHRSTGHAPAGVFYAAFHLPYNLAGAIATGLLFGGYSLWGLSDPVEASAAARGVPAVGGVVLSLLALDVSLRLDAEAKQQQG